MDARQCRAGRAMLRWSTDRLARKAGTDGLKVVRFEAGGSDAVGLDVACRLRDALERGDKTGRIRFIMSGDFAGGVAFAAAATKDESHRNPMLKAHL
jgi:hypothetical protein